MHKIVREMRVWVREMHRKRRFESHFASAAAGRIRRKIRRKS